MSGVNALSTKNKSASFVSDATHSFEAIGPVISISSVRGLDKKVTPSDRPLYFTDDFEVCGSSEIKLVSNFQDRHFVHKSFESKIEESNRRRHGKEY